MLQRLKYRKSYINKQRHMFENPPLSDHIQIQGHGIVSATIFGLKQPVRTSHDFAESHT